MTTLHLGKSIGWSPLRLAFLLIPLVLTCFALSPTAQAQLPPPAPDGGYPNGNTAEGDGALFSLTTGIDNTANGFNALFSNTTGDSNTANGYQALQSNTGIRNTAVGYAALANNTTGDRNTATGRAALPNNTTGARNTADGQDALFNNLTGNDNAATGHFALFSNGMRSLTAQEARTPHWALRPAKISPRGVTISISATLVLPPSPIPSALARREPRRLPMWLALRAKPVQKACQSS